MYSCNNKLSAFGRWVTIILCFIFSVCIFANYKKVDMVVQATILPFIANIVYNDGTDYISRSVFRQMMTKDVNISSIVLYKFIPDAKTSIYKGQMSIAYESRDGDSIPVSTLVEPINSLQSIQEILLNKVKYSNVKTIQIQCENQFEPLKIYSCDKYKQIGLKYKSMIYLPITNSKNFGVLGYLMVTLDSEYNNIEIQDLVNLIKPNVQNLERILKYSK